MIWHHWPVLGWLWLLWILLWGSVSPLVLLTGPLVAAAIVLLFPLPALAPRLALRPLRLAALAGHLVTDIVCSTLVVAREAVWHGPRTRAAIVEVPLRSDSDLLITATAHLATMTPGTLVLEVDRERQLLYVHALPVRGPEQVQHRRDEVRDAEQRVSGVLGRESSP